eukprot:3823286-Rhodomonas_salina.1
MKKRVKDASLGTTLDLGALSCVHDTHSGSLPSFFTHCQVLCCVLSSLGGTGDAAELSTIKALLQWTMTLNIQSQSRARQGALQTLSRGRSKSPLHWSRSAPSQAFPALDVTVSQQSGWTRTGHRDWHP